MNKRILPYGGWPSAITASMVAGTSLRLGQPCVHGDAIYWTESRPNEQGRSVLVRWTQEQGCMDITPHPYSVQSKVHDYGGGAYTINDDAVYFVNRQDQCIYRAHDGGIKKITQASSRRFADLAFDNKRKRLLAVCENHDPKFSEPETTLVAITLDGQIITLAEGADFYSSPRLSSNGKRLAWLEWNHPNMPWDSTTLFVADMDNGKPRNIISVAGGKNESVMQPLWRNNNELIFATDPDGWWNLYAWNGERIRRLHESKAEFALPHWVFGMQSYGVLNEDALVVAYSSEGTWRVAILDIPTGTLRDIRSPYTQIEHLHAANGISVMHAAAANRVPEIVKLDASGTTEVLRASAKADIDAEYFPPPEPFAFNTAGGGKAYGLYYRPAHPDISGPADEQPPLIVKAHGGPTGATSSALDWKIRFWTSRGFAVLDVNYRGSTGYGRGYREQLYGQWGIADVEDVIAGAREMARRGLADPKRLLISGSSAGGFTVLCALTFHDVFAAGASYYGVSEPEAAMTGTEKFESRYGDKLIGPLPETRSVWRARSPLHHADRLNAPVIFLQGLDDAVVPPEQSERMFEALNKKGIPTEYLPLPGEGHGFRQAASIKRALESEYAFYCRILGISTEGDMADPAIGHGPPGG